MIHNKKTFSQCFLQNNPEPSIVTFGEIMMRLATENNDVFLQADRLALTFAGTEANVAVGLANLGCKTKFVTKVPDNEIGNAALNSLRKYGVDTSLIVHGGKRLGVYFCEMGFGARGNRVIYDRENSSFALSQNIEYDWDLIFTGISWFHLSGVTAALLPIDILLEALNKARDKKIIISIDYNYRSKLWTRKIMAETMQKLVPFADVLFCGESDALDLLKQQKSEDIFKQLKDEYSIKIIATTSRNNISASKNEFSAKLYVGSEIFASKLYTTEVIDRFGAGDAFDCGLIYALVKGYDYQKSINFATSASILKLTTKGDFLLSKPEEIEKLVQSGEGEKIDR